MIYEQFGEEKFKYRNRKFWCRGYYVDIVGKDAKKDSGIHQTSIYEEDKMGDQLRIPLSGDPFTCNR